MCFLLILDEITKDLGEIDKKPMLDEICEILKAEVLKNDAAEEDDAKEEDAEDE